MSRRKKRVMQLSFNPRRPLFVDGADVWCANSFHRAMPEYIQPHAWLQIHDFERMKTRDDELYDDSHYQWLLQEHDFPIYMQWAFDDVPSSVRYPIEKTDAIWRGCYNREPSYGSSFSYLIAMAILEKYDRIVLSHMNLLATREAYMEAPNAMEWLAIAQIKYGIEIDWRGSRLGDVYKYGYEHRGIPEWAHERLIEELIIDRDPLLADMRRAYITRHEMWQNNVYPTQEYVGDDDGAA